jgi:tellurite resistance protein TehA-like permease
MLPVDKEIEAVKLLRDEADKARALAILREPARPLWRILLALAALTLTLFTVLAEFKSGVWVKALIAASFAMAFTCVLEISRMSRQLEALKSLILKREE